MVAGVVATALVGLGAADGTSRERPSAIQFRPVLSVLAESAEPVTNISASDRHVARAAVESCDVAAVAELRIVPATRRSHIAAGSCIVAREFTSADGPENRYLLGPAIVAGEDVLGAAPVRTDDGWAARLRFTERGAVRWDRLRNERRAVVVTSGAFVLSHPPPRIGPVRTSRNGGTALLGDDLNRKAATTWALVLKPGPIEFR